MVRFLLSLLTAFLALKTSGQPNVVDSLLKIIQIKERDTIELKAQAKLVDELLRKDVNQAQRHAHQLLALAHQLHHKTHIANGYYFLTITYLNLGNQDSAKYFLRQLESFAQANPSYPKITGNFNQAAGLFYKNTGQPKLAVMYMLKNLDIAKKEDAHRAGVLLNIGNTFNKLADYNNSAKYLLQSLRIFEKIGNKRGASFCLQSLGSTYQQLGQFQAARSYIEKSIQMKQEQNDKRGLVSSYNTLGEIEGKLLNWQRSETSFHEALVLAQELKLPIEETEIHYNLGKYYQLTHQLAKARASLTQGMHLSKNLGDSLLSAKIESEIIGMDERQNQLLNNEKQLLLNLNTIVKAGDRSGIANEYKRLSEFYSRTNDFKKAFDFLNRYNALNDTILNQSLVVQLKELDSKYNSEKKEREIALLKKDQELQRLALSRQRANTTLVVFALASVVVIGGLLINRYRVNNRIQRQLALEKMRQDISRDLHDDIGSALSSIHIMSTLAMQEQRDSVHLQRIASTSRHTLETMSDIVWSINPNHDSLEQLLFKMKEFAGEILDAKNMAYSFEEKMEGDSKHLLLNATVRRNIFLVFKEAVNNAAKYSEGNNLKIAAWIEGKSLNFKIEDDGKGFVRGSIKTGNGLKNMEARANELSAVFRQESSPGNGTKVFLSVPIP